MFNMQNRAEIAELLSHCIYGNNTNETSLNSFYIHILQNSEDCFKTIHPYDKIDYILTIKKISVSAKYRNFLL